MASEPHDRSDDVLALALELFGSDVVLRVDRLHTSSGVAYFEASIIRGAEPLKQAAGWTRSYAVFRLWDSLGGVGRELQRAFDRAFEPLQRAIDHACDRLDPRPSCPVVDLAAFRAARRRR